MSRRTPYPPLFVLPTGAETRALAAESDDLQLTEEIARLLWTASAALEGAFPVLEGPWAEPVSPAHVEAWKAYQSVSRALSDVAALRHALEAERPSENRPAGGGGR